MSYDNRAGIIVATCFLETIAISAVAARFWSRRHQRARLGADDWLILVGLIITSGIAAVEIYGCAEGYLATHLNGTYLDENILLDRLNTSERLELSYFNMGVAALGTIKISIVLLYRRIFTTRIFRKITLVWLIVLIAWTIAFWLGTLLGCGYRIWAIFGSGEDFVKYCGAFKDIDYAYYGSDLATDTITLCLPIPMIWKLHMPMRKKLAVMLIMLVGLLTIGASIGKLYTWIWVENNLTTADTIIVITKASVWNLTECEVAILAACLPTIRPLFVTVAEQPSIQRLLSRISSTPSSLGRNSGAPGSSFASRPRMRPSTSSGAQLTTQSSKTSITHSHVGKYPADLEMQPLPDTYDVSDSNSHGQVMVRKDISVQKE